MLGMTGTINALVRDNLIEGSSVDDQLEFMQDKCSQAAVDLMARKRLALEQQQPAMIAAS